MSYLGYNRKTDAHDDFRALARLPTFFGIVYINVQFAWLCHWESI